MCGPFIQGRIVAFTQSLRLVSPSFGDVTLPSFDAFFWRKPPRKPKQTLVTGGKLLQNQSEEECNF